MSVVWGNGDLLAAQDLSDDVEAARQRGRSGSCAGILFGIIDGANHRLLGIGEFGLRLCQRGCDRGDVFHCSDA